MRKIITVSIVLSLILLSCNDNNNIPKIGILQDKPQEWADALRAGFTEGLIEHGYESGKDFILISRTGMGDPIVMSSIAENFSFSDYSLVYGLGTQASQELFNTVKNKPIIFGAVTDPVQAGFFNDNLNNPHGMITGTQDLWPYPAQFDLIKILLPNIKNIGVVYSSNEINSQISIEYIKKEALKRNINILERTVSADNEIELAVNALLSKKIDLFYIPADNTAQTNSSIIISNCNRKKVPVFTGISGIVENGAIATVGTNYYELGKVNAKQAIEIIFNHKPTKDVPVAIADQGDIYLNLKVAKELGIIIPDEIIKKAFKIYK